MLRVEAVVKMEVSEEQEHFVKTVTELQPVRTKFSATLESVESCFIRSHNK